MPGGKIAPDGRPPQAKGVGKTAKRHDLEAPATPGLQDSDLQSGEVGMLEQGQKVAPRPKRTQGSAAAPARQSATRSQPSSPSEAPDAIEFAAGRMGGQSPSSGAPMRQVDPSAWRPLVERMAYSPNSGGSLAANLTEALGSFVKRPVVSELSFVDFDAADRILGA